MAAEGGPERAIGSGVRTRSLFARSASMPMYRHIPHDTPGANEVNAAVGTRLSRLRLAW